MNKKAKKDQQRMAKGACGAAGLDGKLMKVMLHGRIP